MGIIIQLLLFGIMCFVMLVFVAGVNILKELKKNNELISLDMDMLIENRNLVAEIDAQVKAAKRQLEEKLKTASVEEMQESYDEFCSYEDLAEETKEEIEATGVRRKKNQ